MYYVSDLASDDRCEQLIHLCNKMTTKHQPKLLYLDLGPYIHEKSIP